MHKDRGFFGDEPALIVDVRRTNLDGVGFAVNDQLMFGGVV
jgi:hypothetical protein